MAALRLTLKEASVSPQAASAAKEADRGWVEKSEGILIFEIAKSNGTQSYDWENKISFGVRTDEVSKILHQRVGYNPEADTAKKGFFSSFHDPNKGREGEGETTKILRIRQRTKDEKGGIYFFFSEKSNGKVNSIPIILSEAEYSLVETLLETAVTKMLGW